jgi:Fibronectin type III domain
MADAPSAGGRKILGLKPRTALIAGAGIIGAALLYFWWKGRQSSSSSASSAASSSTSSASAYSTAGQLDALQEELDQLLSAGAPGAASGSGGGTTAAGGGTGTTTAPPPATTTAPPPAATGSPPKTTTPTAPGAPPKTTAPAAKPKPGTPGGVKAAKVNPTSVTLTWDKAANATSYRVRVTYQDKLVGTPHLVTGTSATISGLSPLRTYTFHVAAIGPGGTSAETNGPAVKTK